MPRLRVHLLGTVLVATLIVVAAADAQTPDALPFDRKLRLAKTGDREAQIAVARAYENGTDTNINTVEAAKWYRKAADQGNTEAMFRLARIVSAGAPGIRKNPELAAKLHEAAARLGHAEAQNWLGHSYQHGLGIQQSDASAVEWYKKATGTGLAIAQNNLGLMYLNGKGVARDYAKAFALFKQAANQGDAWAINNLGGLYEMGWGVKQDPQRALASYKQAFEKGNKHAGENLKRLSAALGQGGTTASVEPTPDLPEPQKPVEEKPVPKAAEKPKAADPKAAASVKPSPPRPSPKPQVKSANEQSPPRQKEGKATESSTSTEKKATSVVEPSPAPKKGAQKTFNDSGACRSPRFKRFAAGRMRPCDYF